MEALPAFFRLRDARRHGLSARQVARMVRAGQLHRPLPGVVGSGPPTDDDRVFAALTWGGPDAALSHQTGARLWLHRRITGTIHVTVPFGVTICDVPGVRYHQTRLWSGYVRHAACPSCRRTRWPPRYARPASCTARTGGPW